MRSLHDVAAPAKLNLFLHVTGRRPDGYHLLQSAFVLLDWQDTLHFQRRDGGQLSREDLSVPLPADDLVLRAARALQQASGTALGAHIAIDKRLPAEAAVLELWPLEQGRRYWLVLQDGVPPYGCLTDPLLDTGRYVYVRCALATLLALARGRQDWPGALADGSLTTTGATDLCRRVPEWFLPLAAPSPSVGG